MVSRASFFIISILTTINAYVYSMELQGPIKEIRNKPVKKNYTTKNSYPYLNSLIFQERHKLAAEWTKNSPLIIEIGGGANSMALHCTINQKIIVIDPAVKRKENAQAIFIPKKFEDWNPTEYVHNKQFSIVILGLALTNMPDHGWNKLYNLIDQSERTVIEYSSTFRNAKKQVKSILRNVEKQIIGEKRFDFSQEVELTKNYDKTNPYRNMICLGNQ